MLPITTTVANGRDGWIPDLHPAVCRTAKHPRDRLRCFVVFIGLGYRVGSAMMRIDLYMAHLRQRFCVRGT
jgi:hypothetical protein